MADSEFWLPSDFLSDDFFDDKSSITPTSPFESESEEEDSLTGLTTKMAQDEPFPTPPKTLFGSPQSTLCDGGIWSGSAAGSPTGTSQFLSPPESPFNKRKELPGDVTGGAGILGAPVNLQPFYHPPAVANKSQQAERYYQLQQQQLIKQQLSQAWERQQQQRAKSSGGVGGGRGPLGLPSSAWPALGKQPPPPPQPQQHKHQNQQPQSRSGFRAVFLTGSGQRESTGTGVFLPRRPGAPAEPRKKPACSTVLLPDRVIQALNLKLDDMGLHQPRFPGGFASDQGNYSQQKQSYHRASPATAVSATTNVEVRLPAEWTY